VLSYIVWLLGPRRVDDAAFGFAPAGRRLFARFIEGWPFMLAGGALATAGYGIAIWAMTVAPIALVAALRETGVLFAALIGVVFLGEVFRPLRILAAVLAVGGALLIRLR
jgi:drug/metabolite transporter (DMT)-like permease